ncbi:major facilitator superfamily protein [Gelatoporia subvermispora B]|uniref:Major facilitator superfamily protein n=1 Tax=Ceriporiopsis subvermispora (strain B) TaxID=914234 RepID=M2R9R0_CERS8|nr:major facilitator superfamily protein [Gelatoporia subvermispora B]
MSFTILNDRMAASPIPTTSISYGTFVNDSSRSLSPSSLSGHEKDVDEFPDGGPTAWMTVFGAFLALFCSFGQLNAFGTFQSWYASHQLRDFDASTISWIGSIQLWIFFFSGGFIGRIFDRCGPRPIMALGTVVYVTSIMLTSVARNYYEYILFQGILFGLGVGMLFHPPLAAISTHFNRRRATAIGIAMSGSGLGGTAYPIALQYLLKRLGFAWAVRVSGLACLVICAVALAMVNSRPVPRGDHRPSPWFYSSMLKDTRFVFMIVGSCFIALGLFIPFFYIVSYGTDNGMSAETGFYMLAMLNAGSVAGRLAPPRLADSIGRFALLIPCAFLAGLSSLVFWAYARSLPSLMMFAALYGFFSGAFNALIVPCIAQISDVREVGSRIGLLYSIISFPSLLSGPIAGCLLKHNNGSYAGLITLNGTTIIIGSLIMLCAKLRIDSRMLARV